MATAAACSRVRFVGLGASLSSRARRVLGERALADAEHLIAGPETGHVLADRLHHPGHVHAWNRILGRSKTKAREAYQVRQAHHEMPDAPIHAGRVHANQHLVVADLGPADVPEFQDVGWTVLVLDDRFHRSPANSSGDGVENPAHCTNVAGASYP